MRRLSLYTSNATTAFSTTSLSSTDFTRFTTDDKLGGGGAGCVDSFSTVITTAFTRLYYFFTNVGMEKK